MTDRRGPQLEFDEKVAQRLEILYNTRDVRRRRALVTEAIAVSAGERVLDAGCGPGFYVAELLDVVGPGGSVAGVDASADMIALAEQRTAGHDNVALYCGDLGALPVPDGTVDAALCVQVLEYLDDPAVALRELHRVLRPGGRLVVWDVDWTTVSWHSSDDGRMRRVLAAWDEHLADPAAPRTLGARITSVGFDDVAMRGHAFATNRLDPETYGGGMVAMIADFVAGRAGVSPDDLQAWAADLAELDRRGEFYFSCVQVCFTARKPV